MIWRKKRNDALSARSRLGLFNVTIDTGQPRYLNPPTNTQYNYPNYLRALPVTIASVTDGTSNTLLFAESAYGKLAGQDAIFFGWWTSGDYGDTMFTTLYPINPQSRLGGNPDTTVVSIDTFESAASSFHPGGINAAFADGSVRFIKESINTMPFSQATGIPNGITATANGSCTNSAPLYSLLPGNSFGVWQALSTRAGGEVISSDSY
jgi:prepilin-type processing-associated H-X9-DG protein